MRAFTILVRIANAIFFLATTIYAILTYSPFAYEQFIQPNMIAWLSNFVFLHTDFYWLMLCATLLTVAPQLQSGRGRILAWAYVAVGGIVGGLLTVTRVLPAGDTPVRSVAVAFAALVPLLWLGLIDCLTAGERGSRDGRDGGLNAVLLAAVFVWVVFAVAAPSRLHAAGGIAASNATPQLIIGIAASLAAHLASFTVAYLVVTAARQLRIPVPILVAVALGLALHEVVLAPISVTGGVSWLLALAIAAAVTVTGLGIGAVASRSPVGRLYSNTRSVVVAAVLAPLAAFVLVPILTTFDWGFMLQKLTALLVAAVAFAAADRLGSRIRPGVGSGVGSGVRSQAALTAAVIGFYAVAVVAIPRLPEWTGDPRLQPAFALDAYSAADPSYRVLRQFLDTDRALPGDAEFYAFLRANSSIKVPLRPVDIDFARNLKPNSLPADGSLPNIFLFIIDSLRRDYVSAYNPQVTFTPRIAAFAKDSFTYDRAFSRYGGTGLAVPSIWAGALVAHKQYVTPFAPMNALAKLLDAGNYRRIITRDHITEELFGLEEGTSVLDYRVDEMMHTFCGTMTELKEELRSHAADRRPLFAHTRPLDLHIGNTRFASVPADETYPGFFAPYAARVRQIDGCFGDFLDELWRTGRYDNSIIVLMSDHGDSLGEGLRWGHGYTIVPEVLRIPLIVRVPAALRDRFATDRTRVSFATDVTPSLYALLGITPARPRPSAGVSLFNEQGIEPPSRRHDAFMVASSYGAVYGLVRHNGRRLYIADAIEGRDAFYDLTPGAGDARLGMTDAERQANRALIREQIADLAQWYGYPQP
jgi:arylsulfatase A-like enzyme